MYMSMYTTVKHLLINTLIKQLPAFELTFALIFAVMTVALLCYISKIVFVATLANNSMFILDFTIFSYNCISVHHSTKFSYNCTSILSHL